MADLGGERAVTSAATGTSHSASSYRYEFLSQERGEWEICRGGRKGGGGGGWGGGGAGGL